VKPAKQWKPGACSKKKIQEKKMVQRDDVTANFGTWKGGKDSLLRGWGDSSISSKSCWACEGGPPQRKGGLRKTRYNKQKKEGGKKSKKKNPLSKTEKKHNKLAKTKKRARKSDQEKNQEIGTNTVPKKPTSVVLRQKRRPS